MSEPPAAAPQRAWIGLGSNLGSKLDDPSARLRCALEALAALPASRLGPVSRFYRTAPQGPHGVRDQPDFCNAVAAVDTRLAPRDLLARLQAIENQEGRVRKQRWGPRTLDLDLLLYGEAIVDEPDLAVPHPRMHLRAFVLQPLAEVAPELHIPSHGAVTKLAAAITDQPVTLWA